MNAQTSVFDDGAVAIRAGRILDVGPRAVIMKNYASAKIVRRPDHILIPGLINAHAHVPMSLLRGLADDLTLQEWLEKFIFPAEAKNVDAEFVRWGTRLGLLEMALSGITTYADMYYFEDVIAEETEKAGMRGVLGETIIRFPVPDHKTPEEALAWTEKFIERFKGNALVTPAVAPHAIYTNKPETLRASAALAAKYGVPMLIHVSETRKENDDALRDLRMSPALYLKSLGALPPRTLFAHTVHTDERDWAVMKELNIGAAHCPSSNMKLASGAAPVEKMLDFGLQVGLGTDGPAGSNNDFNLFEEMDLAAKLAKVTSANSRSMPAKRAFAMATIGGARAMGMDKEIGSLEVGKKADLVLLSTSEPHAAPAHDVYSMIVYALKASDVRDVMVEGRFIVQDRKPLTLKAPEILSKAEEYRRRVEESLRSK
jgi:5-methylthioadenosine/S-adenosylhomocysteine deaminase